jgi:membrane-associated HD superfamily phosphohydrolase
MRTEMATTTSELTSKAQRELAARMAAEAEAEAARLQLGGTKQQMAKTAAELERERETAAAMKDRVNKLNTNFMQTSDQLRSTTTELSSKLQREAAARAAAEAESEEARLSLGGTKQQMAKTAAQLEREREVAQEMKTRVKALNETYMNSGGWPGCVLSSA